MDKEGFLAKYKFLLPAFIIGCSVYNLKLVSLISLIENLDIKYYPILIFIQGVLILLTINLMKSFSKKSDTVFYLCSAFLAMATMLVNIMPHSSLSPVVFSSIIFLMSSLSLTCLELTLSVYSSKSVSVLENPNFSSQLMLAFETGIIASALGANLFDRNNSDFHIYYQVLPLAIFVLFFLRKRKENQKTTHILKQKIKRDKVSHSRYKFIKWVFALFIMMAITKNIQGFLVFLGIRNLASAKDASVTSVFSTVALIQNSLIMLHLIVTSFRKTDAISWKMPYQVSLLIQTIGFILNSVFPTSFFWIGTGSARKFSQHALLSQAKVLLISSFPSHMRSQVTTKSSYLSSFIGFSCLSIISYLYINKQISSLVICLLGVVCSLVTLFCVSKLQDHLNKFNIKNIKLFYYNKVSYYEIIESCLALINTSSKKYTKEIVQIVSNRPKSSILVPLVRSLGQGKRKNVKTLRDLFFVTKNEEARIQILTNIKKLQGRRVDKNYFRSILLEALESEMGNNFQEKLAKIVTDFIPLTAKELSISLLENPEKNQFVKAHAIEILGHYANMTHDQESYEILEEYLDDSIPRILRMTALKYCHKNEDLKYLTDQIMVEFVVSGHKSDQTSLAYLIGQLKLSEYKDFLADMNQEYEQSNPTIICALLNLDELDFIDSFIKLIDDSKSSQNLLTFKSFANIDSFLTRRKIYKKLINNYEDKIETFLFFLDYLDHDFDKDIRLIIEETRNLGIEITYNEKLLELEKLKKNLGMHTRIINAA